MQTTLNKQANIFSASYWRDAAGMFKSTKVLVFAAAIIALRVIAKFVKIPIASGLFFTTDCYVNALGSFVYGPIVALAVGAISDTLGCLIAPTGPYFFPYIFVEMGSAFIFALFFWRRNFTVGRSILAKFSVNFVCNIILNTIFYKWYLYYFSGVEKAVAYNWINLARVMKSLIMFPLEAIFIVLFINAALPALRSLKLVNNTQRLSVTMRHIVLIVALLLISLALVLFYIFFLKDFLSAHNIKLL